MPVRPWRERVRVAPFAKVRGWVIGVMLAERGDARATTPTIRRVRGRRVWWSPERVHIQIRELPRRRDGVDPAGEIEAALEALAGVQWARVNAHLGRVVVACNREPRDTESIVVALLAAEARLGLEARSLATAPHPGDPQAIARVFVEVTADAASFGIGQALRLIHRRTPLPVELDLAALVAVAETTPWIRQRMERLAGRGATELGLELVDALLQSIRQSDLGPTAGMCRHALALRELQARRRAWGDREQELCARADAHDREMPTVPARPRPLGPGPVERYADRAVPAALGATAFTYASIHQLGGALSPLFAGLPAPAHLGREAFFAHLGRILARRGVVVFDTQKLRLLDRLDCALVEGALLAGDEANGRRLVDAAKASGLFLVVAGGDPAALSWVEPDKRLEPGDDLAVAISELQAEGRGVCFVGHGPPAAHRAADCGIGVPEPDGRPPWGADVITGAGLADARVAIEAIPTARKAAQQSVQLAVAEAAAGLSLSFAGLKASTTRRIMQTTSAAAILAMINGVRHAHGLERIRDVGPPPDEPPWHEMSADEVLARLESRLEGLTDRDAARRYRPPRPAPSAAATWARMVGEELASPLAPVLAAGAGLSALVGSVVDAALIGSVVVINGMVGGGQRYRAERAVTRLRRRERRQVRVSRAGAVQLVGAHRLVPGDVIKLGSGEVVPADCRLLRADTLEVDEGTLTGESLPVVKTPAAVSAVALADRTSMLYEGTSIAAGRAVAVVVRVGAATEARRAAADIGDQGPVRGVERRLNSLAWVTAPAAVISGLAITGSGLLRRLPAAEVVGSGVGLAVAAVPEGLPILATLSQLAAAGRLSERGALVRDPRALEALGRVDVLCADKTGTLTEGRIRLSRVSDGTRARGIDQLDDDLRHILAVARRASPERKANERLPHMTDQALVEGAQRASVPEDVGLEQWRRVVELPFEPSRGYYATLSAHRTGQLISVKGAPEVLLPECTDRQLDGRRTLLSDGDRRRLLDEAILLARQGLRVLAVAEREVRPAESLSADHVSSLTFRGFIGLSDPVHPSAREAMAQVRRAGVRPIMLTGDHPSTANAIAAELGLLDQNGVITGPELDEMDDDALAQAISTVSVCARTTPAHKVRIIRALQSNGRVVAMTGDGANDSPAIQLADAGIAIGSHAASAAREAADLVVTDGRIETIVEAILEGRALWPAVRDAVSVLVGGNLGEIAFSLIGGVASGHSPLNARQLLLVNLVTDTLPALALALRPPRRRHAEELLREGLEAPLGHVLTRDLLWRGAVTAGAAEAGYLVSRLTGGTRARAGTVALLALTGAQLGQTLVAGWESRAVVATGLGSMAGLLATVQTPIVSRLFGCRPLGPVGLVQAGAVTALATGASIVVPSVPGHVSRLFGRRARRGDSRES